MTAKQVIRNRPLTPEEAATYRAAREEIAKELPELVARHHERVAAAAKEARDLLSQLRELREAAGLSLADVAERAGMNRTAIHRLESSQASNPTILTLMRYAAALGKRIIWSVGDAP